MLAFAWAMATELRGEEATSEAPPPPGFSLKKMELGPGQLDVGGSFRLRGEYMDNVNVRGYGEGKSDSLLLFRTRLNFEYRLPDNGPRARVEFQDSRYTWSDLGKETWRRNAPYRDESDLKEAYLEWRGIGGSPFGFKAGRQAIKYGDRHVFGPGDWGNVGKFWWDAVKLMWETDLGQLDLLYGRRVTSRPVRPNTTHFPFEMYTAYFQGKKIKSSDLTLKPDVFYVFKEDDSGTLKGEEGTGDERIHSFGFLVEGQWGPGWDFGGTLIGQTGEYGGDDVKAFNAVARAGHTWTDLLWEPRLAAEVNYGR
ncbi:MAG: alginate export family protein, partial [Kiritimatiellae bacterium]|nr:alginate export family protein [Kiritimatiellia bacterium]